MSFLLSKQKNTKYLCYIANYSTASLIKIQFNISLIEHYSLKEPQIRDEVPAVSPYSVFYIRQMI